MDENAGFDRLAEAAGVAKLRCCNERDLETEVMRMDGMVFISGECRNCKQTLKIKIDERKFEELKAEAQQS